MSAPRPEPRGGQGFEIVAGQLGALAGYFEQFEDAADGLAARVREIDVSGAQTGRCCRPAGDELRGGLRRVGSGLAGLGSRALDLREALHATACAYDQADGAATRGLVPAGGER
jgi:hypothetical protein